MKYRGTSKVKLQHQIIDGFRPMLEKLGEADEIQAITPGRIKPIAGRAQPRLAVQYETVTGLKCIAHGKTAVQEIFIVTRDPRRVRDLLTSLSP